MRHALAEPERATSATSRARVGAAVASAWQRAGFPPPRLALEPGRALVGQAGVTLYRVRTVKRLDGGDVGRGRRRHVRQPPAAALRRPLHRALPRRARTSRRRETVSVAGLHCESGDVAHRRRRRCRRLALGDLLAVPATGAYTLAMSSNYNATPRPAAVLVRDGEARVIRRRETVDDLLAQEV